jgi:hypothetical protein
MPQTATPAAKVPTNASPGKALEKRINQRPREVSRKTAKIAKSAKAYNSKPPGELCTLFEKLVDTKS